MGKDAGGGAAAGEGPQAELLAVGYDKMRTPNSSELPAGSARSHSHSHSRRGSEGGQAAHGGGEGADGQGEEGAADGENASDLMHGINSFWALVFPICVTMILASLVVVNYRSDSITASMQCVLNFMTV